MGIGGDDVIILCDKFVIESNGTDGLHRISRINELS